MMIATVEKPTTGTNATVERARQAADDARAHMLKLRDAEVALGEKWLQLRRDLAEAELKAGDVLLAGILNDAKSDAKSAAKLEAIERELAVVEHAIAAARRERPAAILAHWEAQAATFDAVAAEHHQAADAHAVKTNELLAALLEHEGVHYVPSKPTRAQIEQSEVIRYKIPTSDAMRHKAAGPEQQARALRSRKVTMAGEMTVSSVDDLIAQLRALGPAVIGPALPEAVMRYDELEALERERQRRMPSTAEGYAPPNAPVRVAFRWRDGSIDSQNTRVVRQD